MFLLLHGLFNNCRIWPQTKAHYLDYWVPACRMIIHCYICSSLVLSFILEFEEHVKFILNEISYHVK